jgi:hypothetical protein
VLRTQTLNEKYARIDPRRIYEYNHHTRYMKPYRTPPLYYIKTLKVGQHHTMDPLLFTFLFEGASSY